MCCSALIIVTTYSSYYAITSTTPDEGPAWINIKKLEQHLFYHAVLGGLLSVYVKNAQCTRCWDKLSLSKSVFWNKNPFSPLLVFFFVNHQNSSYNLLQSNSLWTLCWKLPCVYSLHSIKSELDWMASSSDLHMNTKLLQGSAAVSVGLSYF